MPHMKVLQLANGLWNRERRIAITGIADGGKTVFLTSLISHISEHEALEFPFGKKAQINGYREIHQRKPYSAPFRYAAYRDRLSRLGQWPEKTRDCLHYSCEFSRSDWRMSTSRLHFFDFPGERIADAAIAAMPDYGEWADHMMRHLMDHSSYEELAKPFIALQYREAIEREELIRTYKQTLGRLILNYKPLISPSTFLLDSRGRMARGSTPEELAATQTCGLGGLRDTGETREFAPLLFEARENNPDLAGVMAQNYQAYRDRVVMPIFDELSRVHRIIVLFDIPMLLAGGVGRYNDNRQILFDLFETLRPDSSVGSRLLKTLMFWNRPLDRIALVATKADMVHPSDIANGRLESLLRAMTERAARMLPTVKIGWFTCSAMVSTRPGASDHTLIGRTIRNNPDRAEMEFDVSPLPESWPHEWEPGEFNFYRLHPNFPRNHQVPPRQFGLERIFDFITRE